MTCAYVTSGKSDLRKERKRTLQLRKYRIIQVISIDNCMNALSVQRGYIGYRYRTPVTVRISACRSTCYRNYDPTHTKANRSHTSHGDTTDSAPSIHVQEDLNSQHRWHKTIATETRLARLVTLWPTEGLPSSIRQSKCDLKRTQL